MPAPAPLGAFRTPAWAHTIDALSPAVRYRLAGVLGVLPAGAGAGRAFDGALRERFEQLVAGGPKETPVS